jgi:uncharacterized protein YbjT (DUF2867 family)
MHNTRVALIAGSTGLVGGHCLRALCGDANYLKTVAWGRRAPEFSAPKLELAIGNLEAQDFTQFSPTDAFCALGTTIKVAGSEAAFRLVDLTYVTQFAQAALAAGATRFVLVSSLGADPQSRIFYNRVKGEAEAAVRALGFTTTVILRPSVLAGDRPAARPLERASIAMGQLVAPLMLGNLRKYRPIRANLVADAMVREALHAAPGCWILESDAMQ